MDRYRPSKEELGVINKKFAKEPYASIDELYVFWTLAIDDLMVPDRFIRFHTSALRQFLKDLEEGVSFLVGHDKQKLPFARAFKGRLIEKDGQIDLYTKQFMQKNLNVSGLNTDEFMRAYLGGTIQDVSISFDVKVFECSICGKDIRDPACEHWPGKTYKVKEDDKEETLCFAWAKSTPKRQAKLLEISAVFEGAVPRAKMKGKDEVPSRLQFLNGAKDLKNSEIEEPVCMAFSMPFKEVDQSFEGGENQMEFDLTKFLSNEYSDEELKDLRLVENDINEILNVEVSEEEAKVIKDNFSVNELFSLLKEYPAYELLISDELARWTRKYINSLPNSSFAVIEPAYTRGETQNKNARHLPHHNEKGGGTTNENLDLPHLRNAFARVNQINPVTDSISKEELRRKALAHLENHRGALEGDKDKQSLARLENEKQELEVNLKAFKDKNFELELQVEDLKTQLESLRTEVKKITDTNIKLQKDLDALKDKAKEGEAYRKDLIDEALLLGVKLYGNEFNKETWEKTLNDPKATLDEIKKTRDQFRKELADKFPLGRVTQGNDIGLPDEEKNSEAPDEAFKIG